MSTPIYILAGQSNANAMAPEFQAALEAQSASSNYIYETVAASGAPLTWQRAKEDWLNDGELRAELYSTIYSALVSDPDAYVAGIIWVQGEADTYALGSPNNYAEMMQELIQDIRDQLALDFQNREINHDGFDLIISGLSDNAPEAENRDNWDLIQEEQSDLNSMSSEFQLIDPDEVAAHHNINAQDMFKDGLHYSNAFQTTLMNALVETLLLSENSQEQPAQLIENGFDSGLTLIGGALETVSAVSDTNLNDHSNKIIDLILLGSDDINGNGNKNNNTISGNSGDNIIKGYVGHDTLNGADGEDVLYGGFGNDVLNGGNGWDMLYGGAGNDVFVFDSEDVRWAERVMDFEDGKDIIQISINGVNDFDDLAIYQHSSLDGIVVNYGSGSFVMMGVEQSMLSESDFIFI